MSLKRRVDALEQADDDQARAWLVLRRDMHDHELYHDAAGGAYRRGSPSWPDDDRRVILIHRDIVGGVSDDTPGDFNLLPANWQNGKPPKEIR